MFRPPTSGPAALMTRGEGAAVPVTDTTENSQADKEPFYDHSVLFMDVSGLIMVEHFGLRGLEVPSIFF